MRVSNYTKYDQETKIDGTDIANGLQVADIENS